MKGKLLVPILTMLASLPAMAQFDAEEFAANLRARYGLGPPLATETFAPRPGVEIIVDFAANGHVCRIQLPSNTRGSESGVRTTQLVDDVLTELVPLDIRGRELGRFFEATGAPSVSGIQYENVTISDSWQGEGQTGTTVIFAKEECPNRLSQ